MTCTRGSARCLRMWTISFVVKISRLAQKFVYVNKTGRRRSNVHCAMCGWRVAMVFGSALIDINCIGIQCTAFSTQCVAGEASLIVGNIPNGLDAVCRFLPCYYSTISLLGSHTTARIPCLTTGYWVFMYGPPPNKLSFRGRSVNDMSSPVPIAPCFPFRKTSAREVEGKRPFSSSRLE